jgi:hypothetical protein
MKLPIEAPLMDWRVIAGSLTWIWSRVHLRRREPVNRRAVFIAKSDTH